MPTLDRRRLLQAAGVTLSGWALGGCRAPAPLRVPARLRQLVREPTTHPPAASAPAYLPLPDLSEARVLRFVAGLRPYRAAGPRVEAERSDGRLWIHNHGHGGAGLTLALGCAEDVRATLRAHGGPGRAVVVVGAGVVGLSAALALLRDGHGVRVLAAAFPPHTTSDVAGGQFSPSLVGRPPAAGLERWVRASHAALKRLEGREWGVSEIDNYTTGSGGHGLERIPRDLLPQRAELERLPFPGRARRGQVYRTLLIEPPRFLPRLVHEVRELGGVLQQRSFVHREELLELDAPVIVLCTGLGTRALAPESELLPLRGQLVHLEAQDLGYLLSHTGYLFARSDVLLLGGTVERGVEDTTPDEATCRRLLERHRAFFA